MLTPHIKMLALASNAWKILMRNLMLLLNLTAAMYFWLTTTTIIIIIYNLYGPCRALASLFGFLNLIRHVVGILWTSDQLVAEASTADNTTYKHNTFPRAGFGPAIPATKRPRPTPYTSRHQDLHFWLTGYAILGNLFARLDYDAEFNQDTCRFMSTIFLLLIYQEYLLKCLLLPCCYKNKFHHMSVYVCVMCMSPLGSRVWNKSSAKFYHHWMSTAC
jgi:hypothetical protein